MKNKEAPFMWINRIIHPIFTSRMMCITLEKARALFVAKCMDSMIPDTICIPRHSPRSEPMFHR